MEEEDQKPFNIKNAVIYLVTKDNKVLLNRTPKTGVWQIPGGGVDSCDATTQDTALRELCEEIFPETEIKVCHVTIGTYFRNKNLPYLDFPVKDKPTTRIFFAEVPDSMVKWIKDTDLQRVKNNESDRREWVEFNKIGEGKYKLREVTQRSFDYIKKHDIINVKLKRFTYTPQLEQMIQQMGGDSNDKQSVTTIKKFFQR